MRNGPPGTLVSCRNFLLRPPTDFKLACETSGCSSGKVAGLIFFLTFSFLWTSQVIGNVALATLAGGASFPPHFHPNNIKQSRQARMAAGTTSARVGKVTWYDSQLYVVSRTCSPCTQPKRPTLSALGRASTLSLGSIAFGSLIVTLLEILKMVLHAVQSSANAEGHRKSAPFTVLVLPLMFHYSRRGLPGMLRIMFCGNHREPSPVFQPVRRCSRKQLKTRNLS